MTEPATQTSPSPAERVRAYAVHVYTASGVGLAFLAAAEICSAAPDPRRAFLLLFGAVLIDASDGTLARRWHVKRWAASIDGRTIDDIVDYLTYTFLPLLLMWRMEWLPQPAFLWIIPALVASLFGFANTGAKDETGGFFLGFPSYWNVVAFYAGLWEGAVSQWGNAFAVVVLTALTVAPVRFLYPNLTPHPWRTAVIGGAALWLAQLVAILWRYPAAPRWLVWSSLAYPLFYAALSLVLDRRQRVASPTGGRGKAAAADNR